METKSDVNVQPYEKASKLSLKQIVINNFIGGLVWALGATIGLSVIIGLLTLITKNINLVPIVGSFISDILNFIISTNPNFHK